MEYRNQIVPGVFIKRINRFIAEVEIEGKTEIVHVRNTGRCKEIFIPGANIFLEKASGVKKTNYSLVAVLKGDRLINVDSQIVNYVFEEGVKNNQVDFLNNPDVFLREKVYNKSRFDFYYKKGFKKGFIEIKGVTLEKENQTMFPDAPTSRGQKHVKELAEGIKEGYENYIVFLIQMDKTESFRPHWETDPVFAEELKEAKKQGVKVIAYDTIVCPDNIKLNKTIDVIFYERPSYLGAMNALNSYYPEYVEIETDDEGMIISDLKEKLVKYKERLKMIYVIPDFQNPTSRCWSKERRIQFLEALNEYDIPVIEDGAYSEVRFEGEPEPSLFALDNKDKVIYLGPFSKIFCPGFRVAWLAGSREIISKYLALKPGVDLSSSSVSQRYIDQYLEDFDIDIHIKRTLDSYKEKRNFVIQKMKNEFPKEVKYNIPKGGLFFWLVLPEDKSAKELLKLALRENVAFVPVGSVLI